MSYHYKKRKRDPVRYLVEHAKPWRLKYRLVRFKYYRIVRNEMDRVYWVQARLWWLPIWVTIDEWNTFGTAYREMKKLRGVPQSEIHVYTEDECVLELLGEMEDES